MQMKTSLTPVGRGEVQIVTVRFWKDLFEYEQREITPWHRVCTVPIQVLVVFAA
jgi:hypothetical protein